MSCIGTSTTTTPSGPGEAQARAQRIIDALKNAGALKPGGYQLPSSATQAQLLAAMAKAPAATPTNHTVEIEINDYPQPARWKVMQKTTHNQITEFTGCAVTPRGIYVAPGTRVPPGESKLRLHIEGPTAEAVKQAKTDLMAMIEEAIQAMGPQQAIPGGRYTVV
eukprot:gnl/Spiro4/3724_TR1820_c0_g2_i2.p2 gnl/Spiro4/3724_TR1820_c0_g2~~gnl/Spiro4/3724_TR1820_c0_g2_i2.p2  ORF type:complete len:165 (-),score=60.31 gnl/Spiro4/3724_TR1820_c0_g2_i2:44-538(-)